MEWFPEWRSDKYGNTEFKRLETILHMAYLLCKDIDSTDMADHWPEEIRFHVAQAYDAIYKFNRNGNGLKQDINNDKRHITVNLHSAYGG